MDKEKEIDEIKTLLLGAIEESSKYFREELKKAFARGATHFGSKNREKSLNDFIAESIINAGYRKADKVREETAKEVLEKIEEKICCFTIIRKSEEYDDGYGQALADVSGRIQQVKKEYGVEVEHD